MPVSRTILRVSAFATLAGAGLILAQQQGLVFASATPEPGPVTTAAAITPDTPPEAPAMPRIPDPAAAIARPSPAAMTAPDTPPAAAPLPPAERSEPPVIPATEEAMPDTGAPATETVARNAFGLPCGLELHGTAMPGAMVALDIAAPCRPGMRVEISHSGLTVTAATDAVGLLTMDLPALQSPAIVTVRLADGTEDETLTDLPDLGDIGRVAVSWAEDRALELHAFESGAAFGAPGHVWQEAPGDRADLVAGTGGVLTGLGDPTLPDPLMAQVYSFPRAIAAGLSFSVDIPVTEDGCGQPLTAMSHEVAIGGVETRRIALTLPGCDAVGDYLLLQNLFRDRRLAAN